LVDDEVGCGAWVLEVVTLSVLCYDPVPDDVLSNKSII
jgi:hypothetical protein